MITTANSSLYWIVHKIHHIGEDYVKLSLTTYYKTSGKPCEWIPRKNYKILRNAFDSWRVYEKENV